MIRQFTQGFSYTRKPSRILSDHENGRNYHFRQHIKKKHRICYSSIFVSKYTLMTILGDASIRERSVKARLSTGKPRKTWRNERLWSAEKLASPASAGEPRKLFRGFPSARAISVARLTERLAFLRRRRLGSNSAVVHMEMCIAFWPYSPRESLTICCGSSAPYYREATTRLERSSYT